MPHVIAHRGCPQRAPENSLAGIGWATHFGMSAIECDVALAADGVAVIFHDQHTVRMTGVEGEVEALSSAELCARILRFEGRPSAERIPTAEEFCRAVDRAGLMLHYEVKIHRAPVAAVVDAALDALHASGLREDRVRVSSFSLDALVAVHAANPRLSLGFACEDPWELRHAERIAILHELGVVSVHADVTRTSNDRLQWLRASGFEVNVYTVNHRSALTDLDLALIDGLFTDVPELLI